MVKIDRIGVRSGLLAAGWSIASAVLGMWWLAVPTAYPFGAGDPHADMSLLFATTAHQAAWVLLATGPVGILAGIAAGRPRRTSSLAVAVATVFAMGFGLLVPDLQLLILLTYLLAILSPLLLVTFAAAALVRHPVHLIACVGVVVAVVLLLGGVVDGQHVGALITQVAAAGSSLGSRPLVAGFFLVGGGLWAWTAVIAWRRRHTRCGWCGRPARSWASPRAAARWGRWVTIAAALCPLPYAVVRMTWLLPPNLRIAPAGLDAEPGLRLFGLLIGAVAVAASILTLGLVAKWGERWPEWLPRLAGRRIAPMLPVSLAGAAAVLITIGGISMIRQSLFADGGDWSTVVVMPFLFWGPVLGAGALAHYYRRRSACRHCGLA
ncbi:hypothetical protein ABTZ44_12205 [Microbacterium oxydans]|uniref:hypothetical protein n=1 Tax=Microbacterium TaxID=33882 RepID=UPI00187D1872|nr:hypothetical protein [Microbacterium sp. R1]MBE7956390.1 hypothetical protein [Microbacterium sp. R1]